MNRLLIGAADKSALLIDLMHRDLDAGFLLIDTTGYLAPLAINAIPRKYIQRTFYFDATDKSHPPAFNVLNNVAPDDRPALISTLRTILAILYTKGDNTLTRLRADHMLAHAFATTLSVKDATLLDVLETAKHMFPEWDRKDREASILDIETRLGDLFAPPLLRNIVGQPHTTFATKGITIVNIDRSVIGDTGARFLAYLLMQQTRPIYITDLPFLAHDYLAAVFARGTFTVATDLLPSERRHPDLRDALLRMDPHVFWTTKRDADDLVFPLGITNPSAITDLLSHQYKTRRGEHRIPELPLHRNLKAIRKRSRARHTRPRAAVEKQIDRYLAQRSH